MINFISSIFKIILISIIAIVIIYCLILLLKNSSSRKITLYVLSVIVIFSGVFSFFQIKKTLDYCSREIGSAYHIEMHEDYSIISQYDLTQLSLDTEDNLNYKCVISKSPENYNGIDKNYKMLINEIPATSNVCSAGKVESVFLLNYYNTDNEILSTSEIRVIIEYLTRETRITFTTKNINYSVSYLDTYLEINGLFLKVVEGV